MNNRMLDQFNRINARYTKAKEDEEAHLAFKTQQAEEYELKKATAEAYWEAAMMEIKVAIQALNDLYIKAESHIGLKEIDLGKFTGSSSAEIFWDETTRGPFEGNLILKVDADIDGQVNFSLRDKRRHDDEPIRFPDEKEAYQAQADSLTQDFVDEVIGSWIDASER
ncbi:hypothetical protein EWE75_23515 [Sphingomonas populi]|uniref:Uncharacterized protein n=1 Tax=Sphingomonas populi TaxID=2484750 RepID=A0A4Q6XGR4_9SPHN|nr:hypothetical protein [Sphingomonas populi]RZF59120.1 hypothetical protein EWE75_23515 [Sphingomonas populi]